MQAQGLGQFSNRGYRRARNTYLLAALRSLKEQAHGVGAARGCRREGPSNGIEGRDGVLALESHGGGQFDERLLQLP